MRPLQYFITYLKALVRCAPSQFFLACALSLASGFCSGVGLLMLLPLLKFSGWLPGELGTGSSLMAFFNLSPGRWSLVGTLILFVSLVAAVNVLEFLARQCTNAVSLKFLFQLQQELNRRIAFARWTFVLTQKLQDANHLLTIGIARTTSLTTICFQMISDSMVVLVYLALAFHLSAKLTTVTIVMALIPAFWVRKNLAYRTGQEFLRANQRFHEKLAQYFGGIKLAKSSNVTDRYISHFEILLSKSQQFQRESVRIESKIRFLFQVTGAVIFSIVFYLAVTVLKVPILTLVTLLILYSRMMPRINGLQQAYLRALNTVPVYIDLRRLIDEFTANEEYIAVDSPREVSLNHSIRLENISIAYGDRLVLKNIHCRLPVRKTTAIVGGSGAGKTTFADVLLGLHSPVKGKVWIDDTLLGAETIQSWRSQVGYVPQEPYFFNDTVRANLLWMAPPLADELLWAALERVRAADIVRRLKQGLDSTIGDQGIQLSGGERQRLALARALLRSPQVLVLDEATSALDPLNEEWIQSTLRQLSNTLTLIVIAHRYSTIRLADQVLVLEEGELREQGSLESLRDDTSSYFGVLFPPSLRQGAETSASSAGN